MLVDVRDEEGDGTGLTDQEIRDQLVTFYLAGHETTSHALTWTFYLLSQNPQVEARMHAELNDVLGHRLATFEDLDDLGYTERVIKESMRLYPPVYVIAAQSGRGRLHRRLSGAGGQRGRPVDLHDPPRCALVSRPG